MTTDHSVTILTVEDDQLVRKAIAAYLQKLGYLVLQATDGEEGLKIFRRAHPDLVLTDLRLPKLDGMELLSSIQKNLQILLLSSFPVWALLMTRSRP